MSARRPTRALRAPRERLPTPLRAARIAELCYFPIAGLLLLALPVPSGEDLGEVLAVLIIVAETISAVAVFVGLGRRKRWAWLLGVVLAVWVIGGVLLRGGPVVSAALASHLPALWISVALLAWVLVAQAVVLVSLLSRGARVRDLS